MNEIRGNLQDKLVGFRPLQGLSIMNLLGAEKMLDIVAEIGFRPLQGLSIMNTHMTVAQARLHTQFPSPTGVKHYESKDNLHNREYACSKFPSPTGVKHYE